MVDKAMTLLLEQAKQNEHKAQLALFAAQQELENYYKQVEQIEQYRLEYFRKMSALGQQGLSASSYSHLNRFILQLDNTLAQQRKTAMEFENNLEQCRLHWQRCREKTRALVWLIEKRVLEAKKIADKKEQKQQDEFATLAIFHRRNSFKS